MTQAVAKLIKDVKSLSTEEYADFVDEISFMQPFEVRADVERAQLNEVQRRIAEVESGAVELIPGDVALARGRQRLKDLREGRR